MDFGDYIYVILAVVFSIVSAIGKKRKAKNKSAKPSKARSILEELFDSSEVEDPVPQTVFVDEEPDFMSSDNEWEEESLSYVEEKETDLQVKLSSLSYNQPKDVILDTPEILDKKLTITPIKRHSVIDDLRQPNEVRKAVLYAEILQRKF